MSGEGSVTSSTSVPDTTAAEDPAAAQKFAQAALRRLNRELRAVSSCVRTLLRAESEPALLNDICRIVCEEAGYRMAWVGYPQDDEARTIRPVAWGGTEEGYLEQSGISWAETERGRGPAGIAVRSGRYACIQDFATDPAAGPWRELALLRGYRSGVALPLRDEGQRTFGVLAIYSTTPNAFTADELRLLEDLAGNLAFGITSLRTRIAHKRLEQERQSALRFFGSMDRINVAIQESEDGERLLGDVLDVTLSIFECDRAFMLYPCDPDAPTWHIPVELTRPEHPGAQPVRLELPMDPEVRNVTRLVLSNAGPVTFGSGTERPIPQQGRDYGVQSIIVMAIYPKRDKPYMFGLHQCSYPRVWTPEDAKLFQAIGRRLADGLSSLLAHRDVRQNETRLRTVMQTIPDLVWLKDLDGRYVACNRQVERLLGAPEAQIVGKTDYDFFPREAADFFREHDRKALAAEKPCLNEEWVTFADGGYHGLFETVKTTMRDHNGAPNGVVGVARDITERHKVAAAEREIEQLAYYDPLTELPNRRLLMDRLHQALANSSASGGNGALLFIDLDHFKLLNDTSGHEVGDRLLCSVAARLTAIVGESDTLARFGGDEFVVMLENLGASPEEAATEAQNIGARILEALVRPHAIGKRLLHSTPSIGVALFGAADRSVDELIKQADIAMYQAKSAGRNTLRFFDPHMQVALAARASLEAELRLAIYRCELVLHYQPQVHGLRGIIGAEALVRWQHPERGLILPDQFIALAEETGLILDIGRWVLEMACWQLKLWSGGLRSHGLYLAINVSARQFRQPDFVEQVDQALRNAGAPAERLKIELTETLVLDDVEDTIRKMQALKRLGVGFCMDDFGTGYSSLSYLTRLPLDQIKIDRSFVHNLPHSANDAIVVQTIITMARSLGLTAIAEGVETAAQREFLERNGCQACQGYLFGQPVPVAAFEELLVPH
jgi:diguanylate cyclase (GGDEF)-like protein/PAS domain S-box-containing protein